MKKQTPDRMRKNVMADFYQAVGVLGGLNLALINPVRDALPSLFKEYPLPHYEGTDDISMSIATSIALAGFAFGAYKWIRSNSGIGKIRESFNELGLLTSEVKKNLNTASIGAFTGALFTGVGTSKLGDAIEMITASVPTKMSDILLAGGEGAFWLLAATGAAILTDQSLRQANTHASTATATPAPAAKLS